jgi:hypothetical protein
MPTIIQQAPPSEQCLVLYDISWREYVRLGRLLRDPKKMPVSQEVHTYEGGREGCKCCVNATSTVSS